jgi:hypothetical protein
MSMIQEMFSDAQSGTERAERLEALKSALNESIARRDAGRDGFVHHSAYRGQADVGPIGIVKGAGSSASVRRERMEKMAAQFESVAKSMSPAEQAEVNASLAELREMQADMFKDITSTSPGDLHPYDLETPAKQMVPRFRLLGNELPRTKGVGTAREYRRILGYTNAGVGGVPDLMPFFNSESDTGVPVFGQLPLRRGPKISYSMDTHTLVYQEMSVSDEVTSKAQFVNLGFENSRALSQMALLWAHMLGEEKALLYARGSAANGYEGAVAAPVITSAAGATATATIPAASYFVKVTARAGGGESVVSNETGGTAITLGQPLNVSVTAEPTGALGYNLYVGTSSGSETFQTSFVGNSFSLQSYATGGATPPSADSTANANGYDGFLSILADPSQAGYVNRVNAPLYTLGSSTNLGDKPFQDACAALFSSVYADPEEIWLNAVQRRELADWTRSDTTGASAYRITLSEDMGSNVTLGGMVSGIMNESSPTDRIMDLRVHPYMPSGASFIRSRTLDVPNSGIGDTTEIIEVQGYMSVDWPQIQYTWDSSTYWFGAPAHYAPKWSACLLGLQ